MICTKIKGINIVCHSEIEASKSTWIDCWMVINIWVYNTSSCRLMVCVIGLIYWGINWLVLILGDIQRLNICLRDWSRMNLTVLIMNSWFFWVGISWLDIELTLAWFMIIFMWKCHLKWSFRRKFWTCIRNWFWIISY